MHSKGILGPDVIFSHTTNPTPEDIKLLHESGAHVSSTPSTELQMGHGNIICFDANITSRASLGIDCHSATSSSIPTQMNLGLQFARARRHEHFEAAGRTARSVGPTVEHAFNLGTISGARAINMEGEVGSLKVGKKADIVIFDALSPGMLAAAQQDPVAAIVLHSSIRDIDTVIVDGIVRKEGGNLCEVSVEEQGKIRKLSWRTIAQEVLKSRAEIEERLKDVDMSIARRGLVGMWHLDEDKIVDEVPIKA